MNLQKKQANFNNIKMVLIVVALILFGYIGYTLFSNYRAARDETVSTKVDDVQPAPAITEPNDLDEAASTIEQVEVESSSMDDMSEIESEMSAF